MTKTEKNIILKKSLSIEKNLFLFIFASMGTINLIYKNPYFFTIKVSTNQSYGRKPNCNECRF